MNCPYCQKKLTPTKKKCSCGYYFDQDLYEKIRSRKAVSSNVQAHTLDWQFLFFILVMVLGVVVVLLQYLLPSF